MHSKADTEAEHHHKQVRLLNPTSCSQMSEQQRSGAISGSSRGGQFAELGTGFGTGLSAPSCTYADGSGAKNPLP
jgi:hypothetical protein